MALGSSNLSMSNIAAEKGIATSNLSLPQLAAGQMKLTFPTDSSSTSSEYGTFDLTAYYGGDLDGRSGSTVTSAQGQGVNGLNAAPHSMSEWVGFDPGTGGALNGEVQLGDNTWPAVKSEKEVTDEGCFVRSAAATDIYCQKVGSSIRIYVTEITSGNYASNQFGYVHSGTRSGLTGTTEIARITAGTGQALPTTCSMSYVVGTNSVSGGYLGNGSVVTISGGATGTSNLGSTKIGYTCRAGGVSEAGPGTSGYARLYLGVRFGFGGISGVSGTANVEIWCHQQAYANHGSGFQAC